MLLVIDDDPNSLRSVEAALGQHERVLFSTSGAQAFELMGLVGGEITAVLVDLDLPSIDGFEVIREFKARYPKLPLVAISGVFQDPILQSAMLVGAAAALKKPVTPEWLDALERVRSQAAGY